MVTDTTNVYGESTKLETRQLCKELGLLRPAGEMSCDLLMQTPLGRSVNRVDGEPLMQTSQTIIAYLERFGES